MSEVKLFAVGDISLRTKDGAHPFGAVRDVLRECDVLFGNLETALSRRGRQSEKSVVLNADPSLASHLVEAEFDILSIANNHVMDLGPEGFEDTITALLRNNISFVGAGNRNHARSDTIIETNGLRVGFLAYLEGGYSNGDVFINRADLSRVRNDIAALRPQCDIIVVSLHWGIENVQYPSPGQINMARGIIDSGAALVIGHHAHVLQGIETYKNGLIAYSLGNFQFDFEIGANRERGTNLSAVLSVTLTESGVKSYEIIPIKISECYIPALAEGLEGENIKGHISRVTRPIIENKLNWQSWYREMAERYLADSLRSWKKRIGKYGIMHLLAFLRWLLRPFVIRCYISLIKARIGAGRVDRYWAASGKDVLPANPREGS